MNEKYLAENKKLYEALTLDMEELKRTGNGYNSVNSGYELKTNNDLIFSVERYVITTMADTDIQKEFDTIDKKRQILITLPSLFKDDSYIDTISENIISQMRERMKADPNQIYWIDNNIGEYVQPFEKILKDQDFYINSEGNLIISFDRAVIAPGYMGNQEFMIPSNVISNILVGHEYIK